MAEVSSTPNGKTFERDVDELLNLSAVLSCSTLTRSRRSEARRRLYRLTGKDGTDLPDSSDTSFLTVDARPKLYSLTSTSKTSKLLKNGNREARPRNVKKRQHDPTDDGVTASDLASKLIHAMKKQESSDPPNLKVSVSAAEQKGTKERSNEETKKTAPKSKKTLKTTTVTPVRKKKLAKDNADKKSKPKGRKASINVSVESKVSKRKSIEPLRKPKTSKDKVSTSKTTTKTNKAARSSVEHHTAKKTARSQKGAPRPRLEIDRCEPLVYKNNFDKELCALNDLPFLAPHKRTDLSCSSKSSASSVYNTLDLIHRPSYRDQTIHFNNEMFKAGRIASASSCNEMSNVNFKVPSACVPRQRIRYEDFKNVHSDLSRMSSVSTFSTYRNTFVNEPEITPLESCSRVYSKKVIMSNPVESPAPLVQRNSSPILVSHKRPSIQKETPKANISSIQNVQRSLTDKIDSRRVSEDSVDENVSPNEMLPNGDDSWITIKKTPLNCSPWRFN